MLIIFKTFLIPSIWWNLKIQLPCQRAWVLPRSSKYLPPNEFSMFHQAMPQLADHMTTTIDPTCNLKEWSESQHWLMRWPNLKLQLLHNHGNCNSSRPAVLPFDLAITTLHIYCNITQMCLCSCQYCSCYTVACRARSLSPPSPIYCKCPAVKTVDTLWREWIVGLQGKPIDRGAGLEMGESIESWLAEWTPRTRTEAGHVRGCSGGSDGGGSYPTEWKHPAATTLANGWQAKVMRVQARGVQGLLDLDKLASLKRNSCTRFLQRSIIATCDIEYYV
jgi:hypothetical protein